MYKVPASPPCFQMSYRCFALYTMYGGNRVPLADPQYIMHNRVGNDMQCLPNTIIYSVPGPPPTSCTVFAPLFASTNSDATAVQKPVSSQFHTLSLMSFWSNSFNLQVSNKRYTFPNHSSKTAGSLASVLFLERCWGFLCTNCG